MIERFVAQNRRPLVLIAVLGAAANLVNIFVLSQAWYVKGDVTGAKGAALIAPPAAFFCAFWLIAYESWMRAARSAFARRAFQVFWGLTAIIVGVVLVRLAFIVVLWMARSGA